MAVAFQVVYTYVDDSGDTATHAIDIPTTFSLAQYTEFGRAMAGLLDDMVHGRIQSAQLVIAVDISGLTSNAPVVGSDVEEIGSFFFSTLEGRNVLINIPTIDESLVVAGADDVNLSDPNVVAFVTAMETGIAVTGGTISPCDVDEDDIVSINVAREAFRSSGKRR